MRATDADGGSSRQPPSSARSRRRSRLHGSGRRLFAFDRRLGTRLVAGADEAGRGSLAGPLIAAGVLFDYGALTTRDLRSLSALNDSKQHTCDAREELFPLVLRSAARARTRTRKSVRSARARYRCGRDAARSARHRSPPRTPLSGYSASCW